jgi:signal transduction histidine kinase
MSVTPYSGVAPARILLVDENPANRALLAAMLRPLQSLLLEARSADEAARLGERERAALAVVADVTLLPALGTVPCLVMVDGGDADAEARAYERGAADVLIRPVAGERLRARARLLVELHQARTARRDAEAQSRDKDDLLAMVAHELRVPLNAIVGWAEVLLNGKVPAERLHHGLDTIARNARMQARLVEDLLDTSRIIAGKLTLSRAPVELGVVAGRAAETVAPMAKVKDVALEVVIDAGEHELMGDAARLQQVLWNVLSNAVKFSPPRSHVELTLQRCDGQLVLAVRDNGIGIAPELLPHVFERFRQGEAGGTRRHGGLGLGLAIARRIVELHGGTIAAASDGPNRGATFTLTLPTTAREELPEEAAPRLIITGEASSRHTRPVPTIAATPARLDGLRVLFVDDEPDARELLTMVLADAGAEVRTASSAAEALQLLGDERFDVMVSDIGMPGEDGYSLMRKVARRGEVPGIALSAFSSVQDRERALDAGFVTHLAKPLDAGALIDFVHRIARH